jgi:hyperosmotically inducible periplasmic protein
VKHRTLSVAGLLLLAIAAVAADDAANPLDDTAIAARVHSALLDNSKIGARKIDVTSRHGLVLLSGLVVSADEKITASKVAAAVDGVKKVENNLEVRPP